MRLLKETIVGMAKLLMWCLNVMEFDAFVEEMEAEKCGGKSSFYAFSHCSISSVKHHHSLSSPLIWLS